MTEKRVSETELMLPALYFIKREPGITTSRLKLLLVDLLKPTGKDAEIARGERDTSRSITKNRFFSTKTKTSLSLLNKRFKM